MSALGIRDNTTSTIHSVAFVDSFRNVSLAPPFNYPATTVEQRRLSLNPKGQLFQMEYDMDTTKKTFTVNNDGMGWTDGTITHITPLDRITQISTLLPAIRPQATTNSQILAVENTLLVLDDITTATCAINIQADNTGNVGTHFGIDIVNTSNNNDFEIRNDPDYEGSVVFKDFGAGSGTTQTGIKQGTISLTDTATPFTTTFTPTTLTSGASSMTWEDIIAGSGSVGTLNSVLANGNTATGSTASITLQGTPQQNVITPTNIILTDGDLTSDLRAEYLDFVNASTTTQTVLDSSVIIMNDGADSIQMALGGITTTADLTLEVGNDFILNGTNLTAGTSGGFTAQYLRVKINGTYYKMALLAD